jgi:hypothetical protein
LERDVRFGDPLFLRLARVADEAVDPGVDHIDFQLVAPRLDHARQLDAPRVGPYDPEIVAVPSHSGDALDLAELEAYKAFGFLGRQLEGLSVSGLAGEESDAFIRMLVPRGELLEHRRLRRAAPAFEGHCPRAGQSSLLQLG